MVQYLYFRILKFPLIKVVMWTCPSNGLSMWWTRQTFVGVGQHFSRSPQMDWSFFGIPAMFGLLSCRNTWEVNRAVFKTPYSLLCRQNNYAHQPRKRDIPNWSEKYDKDDASLGSLHVGIAMNIFRTFRTKQTGVVNVYRYHGDIPLNPVIPRMSQVTCMETLFHWSWPGKWYDMIWYYIILYIFI